jgi:hypothetical protein
LASFPAGPLFAHSPFFLLRRYLKIQAVILITRRKELYFLSENNSGFTETEVVAVMTPFLSSWLIDCLADSDN